MCASFPIFTFTLHIKFAWRLIRYDSGMFLEVVEGLEEACVSLYEILFDCTWTTVDSKDGAVG